MIATTIISSISVKPLEDEFTMVRFKATHMPM